MINIERKGRNHHLLVISCLGEFENDVRDCEDVSLSNDQMSVYW